MQGFARAASHVLRTRARTRLTGLQASPAQGCSDNGQGALWPSEHLHRGGSRDAAERLPQSCENPLCLSGAYMKVQSIRQRHVAADAHRIGASPVLGLVWWHLSVCKAPAMAPACSTSSYLHSSDEPCFLRLPPWQP